MSIWERSCTLCLETGHSLIYQQRENWQLKSLQAGTDGTGKEERQTG